MSVVKTVNFEDGQALDEADFIALQKRLQAQLFDMAIRGRMRELETSTPSSSTPPRVYSWGALGGIKSGPGTLQSSNRAGMIATLAAPDTPPTGEDSGALIYYLADAELLSTHDAAHATLDRVDLICVKLDQVIGTSTSRNFEDATTREPTSQTTNTDRTVTLTKQIVKGANATAGTAVEPAVPGGFAKYAAVRVPATLATPFPTSHLRDHRMPIGQYDVDFLLPLNGYLQGFATSVSHFQGGVVSAAGGDFCFMPLGRAPKAGRVVRLHFKAKITNGGGTGQIILSRTDMGTPGGGDGAVLYSFGHTGGVLTEFDIIVSGAVVDQAGAVPVATIGPLWGSGFESVEQGLTLGTHTCLSLNFTAGAAGDIVEFVRAEVAGS